MSRHLSPPCFLKIACNDDHQPEDPRSVTDRSLARAEPACRVDATASVVIGGTRVVYNANEKEATIKLSNQGNAPALTQAWLDNGDPKATPSAVEVPFLGHPARDAHRSEEGRRPCASSIPASRFHKTRSRCSGSTCWRFRPRPEAGGANTNHLQLAFRSRIKMFYRPASLKGSSLENSGAGGMAGGGIRQSVEPGSP